jgi:hypothetical protein
MRVQGQAGNARPSRRRSPSERRLATYAVTSGAILAAAGQADAEIIYSGIRDVPVNGNNVGGTPVNVNINDRGPLADPTTDYVFNHFPVPNGVNLTWTLQVTPQGSNDVVTSGAFAAALDKGALISSADPLGGGNLIMAQYKYKLNTLQSSSGPWRGANDKYLGLYFDIPGKGFHFGWARISVSANPSSIADATIHDWAYQTVPNVPILAGARTLPEPSSLTLGVLALGAVGVGALVRYRVRARQASAPSA